MQMEKPIVRRSDAWMLKKRQADCNKQSSEESYPNQIEAYVAVNFLLSNRGSMGGYQILNQNYTVQSEHLAHVRD